MPNVLHLRASGQLLGAERVVLELTRNLPAHKYRSFIGVPVEIGQPIPEFALVAKELGYNVFTFPIKSAFDLAATKAIRQYVRENKIDIIHSHGYREDLYALLAQSNAVLIATNHLWKRTNLKLKIYAWLDGWILKRFDQVIAVSRPVKEDMLSAGIASKKVSIISNGINTEAYSLPLPRNEVLHSLKIQTSALVVGSLSSLTNEKGLNYLIESLPEIQRRVPDIHLLIVGDGEQEATLRSLSQSLGVSAIVTFAGRQSDINRMLSAMDIFALPSLNEGLPMALLEAMAAGKAVVATDVGDVRTVVNKNTGILIRPANTDDLIQSISNLASDRTEIKQLGKQAKLYVSKNFSSQAMTKAYADSYDSLLGGIQTNK